MLSAKTRDKLKTVGSYARRQRHPWL